MKPHGTNPHYQRERRQREQQLARAERQADRHPLYRCGVCGHEVRTLMERGARCPECTHGIMVRLR